MTKTNIVLAAIAVVLAAGCFVLFRDSSAQRDLVRALQARVVQLQREMIANSTASQSDTQAPPADTTAPTSAPPAQAATPPPSQASKPVVAKPVVDANRDWVAVLRDPAYRRARLAEARLQLEQGYPQLVAELGLSGDTAERFLDLLAEQSLREQDLSMDKEAVRDPEKRRRELYAEAEKERRALLGEERFRTWTEFVKSTQARGVVNDLRTQLATTNSPLREEQVKPLVKALAAEHQRHTAEREANYNDETGGAGQWTEATPDSQRIAYMERRAALIRESLDRQQEAGQMYLDSAQQREFNAMLDRQRERARVELESFRVQLEASARTRSRSR